MTYTDEAWPDNRNDHEPQDLPRRRAQIPGGFFIRFIKAVKYREHN